MSLESEWESAHETVDYIASFVLNRVLLFVQIAKLKRFDTTAGAAMGPRAKQIYSEIQTGPRSIVIRSLISFTPLKFVWMARFTAVIPRRGYFSRDEMSKVDTTLDNRRIHCVFKRRLWLMGLFFSYLHFEFPGGRKKVTGYYGEMCAGHVIIAVMGDLWQVHL